MGGQRLIPLKQAREQLGISKVTMARLVKEGRFKVYENPLDRRQKLVDPEEILTAVLPRAVSHETDVSGT